jgi:hypothetical protein
MLRLAKSPRMLRYHTRLQTRVFRVRKADSWCSEMPSSSNGLMPVHHTYQQLGASISKLPEFHQNSQTSPTIFNLASTPAYPPSLKLSHPLIVHQSLNTALSLRGLHKLSSKKTATSDQFRNQKSNHFLALSKLPPCTLYPNRISQNNYDSFKTSPSLTPPPKSLPSTVPLTLTTSLAHGAASPSSHSYFLVCHLAHKPPFATLRRHTGQFPSNLRNGQASSSDSKVKTGSLSTPVTALDSPQVQDATEKLAMLVPKSCGPSELDPYPSGSMTTCSSAFVDHSSRTTTDSGYFGPEISPPTEENSMMEAGSGSAVQPCPTANMKSLTRTLRNHSETSPKTPAGNRQLSLLPKNPSILLTLQSQITRGWAFHLLHRRHRHNLR